MAGSRRAGKLEKRAGKRGKPTAKRAKPGKHHKPGQPPGKTGKSLVRPTDTRALAARTRSIARLLAAEYPDARCMLDHTSPFELLVATILAAQCTDERVNMVTPALFRRFPTPEEMAEADIGELEEMVRSTGFFHSKAKSIQGAAHELVTRFPAGFPRVMEDLLTLPGVGRKTANVILGTCFSTPAIVVDTHFRRVTQRLGIARSADPDEIEREVAALLPPDSWTGFSHAVTFHGRRCCAARKPDHARCPVAHLCDSRDI